MSTKRVTGVVAGALAAWVALRVASYMVRRCVAAARFGFHIMTLQFHRRCPDCKTRIHHDARVCSHCGFRRRPEPRRRRR
jgi:hypothetical protein